MASESPDGDERSGDVLLHAGPPINDATYLGRAVVGSLLIDLSTGKSYICTASDRTTKISWLPVGTQAHTSPHLRDVLTDHLPIVLTALFLGIVFAKLFVVSHGNLQTALGLLSAAGTLEVMFGTLLVLTPILPFALISIVPYYYATTRVWTPWVYVCVAIGAVFLFITAPKAIVVLGLVTALVNTAIFIVGSRRWADRSLPRIARALPFFAATVLLVASVIIDTMWLPTEHIELDSGEHQVGYVLGVEDDSLVVLTEDNRLIDRVNLADVTSRQVCERAELDRELQPLLRPWRDDDDYPDCPE
jgi:hypothetical protein